MEYLELAGAVILNENKSILLMHRNTPKLKQWELPGGKLEIGEEPEQAAKRELKEELGVDVEVKKYLGCEEISDIDCILKYHWYLCKLKNQEPKLMEEKFDEIKYFSKEDLQNSIEELSSNMKTFMKRIDITNL